MPLQAALERSHHWMVQCASLVDGVNFATSERARLAVSLHHHCIEHHAGIYILVENGVYGSAFALFRPQFEADIRGAWLHLCADELQITRFLAGADPLGMASLVRQLEAHDAFVEGSVSRMKEDFWRNLNDFTHGGAIQVKTRNTRNEVTQSYRPHHVAGLLDASATVSLLGGVGIAAVVRQDGLAVALRQAYGSVYEPTA
jgi:hypothetical protein